MFSIYLWKNIFDAALNANGAPKGTINIVMGDSRRFMAEWSANPYVKCIFDFAEDGEELLKSSQGDSMLIWKDAPLEEASESLLESFAGSAPRKVFIHEDIYPQFIEMLLKKVRGLKAGLPRDPETDLSPFRDGAAEFFEFLEGAFQKGGVLLTGGYRINYLGERDPDGLFIAPAVLEAPAENADILKCPQENSFPLLPVFKVRGRGLTDRERDHDVYSGMVRLLEHNPDGFRTSIWVKDSFYMRKFIEDLNQCASVRFNAGNNNSFPNLFSEGMGRTGELFEEMNQVWQKTSRLQWISVTKLDLERSQVRVTVKER